MSAPPPPTPDAVWTDHFRRAFGRYDEELLRSVTGRLIKSRVQSAAEETAERMLAALANPVAVDRKLRDLPAPARRLLALIGHSRQPRWRVGALLTLLAALGDAEGLAPVLTLLEDGLVVPELPETGPPLKGFDAWQNQAGLTDRFVVAYPLVAQRARGEDLGLPVPESVTLPGGQEADGLDWPVRLAVLWQQVSDTPLRRTQSNDFFKRDLTRLRGDPLLTAPGPVQAAEVPDVGLLAVELALLEGFLVEQDGELRAGRFPAAWGAGLAFAVASLWSRLPLVETWDPLRGWQGDGGPRSPYPAVLLLALLLLTRALESGWVLLDDVEGWVNRHHPHLGGADRPEVPREGWAGPLLLGLALSLRLVQAARDPDDRWRVRLSALGRWVLGNDREPPAEPEYRQTLLVQPNFEVVVFRQGLTPALIASLSQFADWKQVGAACQMVLASQRVYRGLEGGQTFEEILQLLNRHGMRPVPDGVVDALKTWANKRERITVYPAATLVEFATAADLESAVARGLVSVRLTDRLALVSDGQMDLRQVRLTGTRDYAARPERCLKVEDDGLTLTVDALRSDLLLESELARVAEPADGRSGKAYRLTQASLRRAEREGMTVAALDEWFTQRSGHPLPPAARLLLTAPQLGPLAVERRFLLEVPDPTVAEGLMQLPDTRPLFGRRLGPTVLQVVEGAEEALAERLRELGIVAELRTG
jgi:hypothetical protein